VLVGPSRKRFVGHVLDLRAEERLEGTLAAVAVAVFGGASLIRVHDVVPAVRVARMAAALRDAWSPAAMARG
jgi:dihydropteroate synthase